jgi:hypothetical protein
MELAQAIEKMGYVYMLDIHSNLTVYLENSEIAVPSPVRRKKISPANA